MRQVAAVLLAVLLVCGTAWASVCDLTCQLGGMKLVCAAGSMNEPAMLMRCGHCEGAVVHAVCSPMQCGHAVVAGERASDDVARVLTSPLVGATLEIPMPPGGGSGWYGESESPERATIFRPLLVALRV